MIDGGKFDGAKAYKDAKMCNMMTVNQLHKRYHESTGITFSSLYPGCIATSNLFREKRLWFRKVRARALRDARRLCSHTPRDRASSSSPSS